MAVRRSQKTLPWTRYSGPKMAQRGIVVPVPRLSHAVYTSRMRCRFYPFHSLFPRRALHPFLSSDTNILAFVMTEELFVERWAPGFCTDLSRPDVVITLSNSSVFVKTRWQTVSGIAYTRKRSARDTPGQASSYRHHVSLYHSVTLQDFEKKSQKLQAAKEHCGDHYKEHMRFRLV